MALLACAKCGGKVSDRATTCPHCGCPAALGGPNALPLPPDSGLAGQAEQNLGRLMRSPKGLYVAAACVLAVILVVAFIGPSHTQHTPPASNGTSPKGNGSAHETATQDYWQSLRAICQKRSTAAKQLQAWKTRQQAVVSFRQQAKCWKEMAGGIQSLPVLNVDTEVTTYAAQRATMAETEAAWHADFADLLEEYQRFLDDSESLGADFEAFVRISLGDSLGPFNEAKAQNSQFYQRWLDIHNRMQGVQERSHSIDAQEIGVRSTLSQRYSREFPKLDD